jgi:hypothetical protein
MTICTSLSDYAASNGDSEKLDTFVNVFERHKDALQKITRLGLTFHTCRLFHDQVFKITDLVEARIPYRQVLSDGQLGLPEICPDKEHKLGCAHAGRERIVFEYGERDAGSPTRDAVIAAIRSIGLHAPRLIDPAVADSMIMQIKDIGRKIAELDYNMGRRANTSTIIAQHTKYVKELFEITQKVETILGQAIQEGLGLIAPDRAEQELVFPMDPKDPYDI